MPAIKTIKAVVAILYAKNNTQILITKRRKNQFMPNYWELPGGKIETGEDEEDALARELQEELGIKTLRISLKHVMTHHYKDKTVNLSIYNVESYKGNVTGTEGQDVRWCNLQNLSNYKLLPTMRIIINRIRLPEYYWITPDERDPELLLQKCQNHLITGAKIIQLRSKDLIEHSYIGKIHSICQSYEARLILNVPNKTFKEPCDGWHLTSEELLKYSKRPCANNKLLGASAHNMKEAKYAEIISVDYISLAPIEETTSHPNATPLGWEVANDIVSKSNLPVYLLGGMSRDSLGRALKIRAQGIAGISQI
ncbi:MAG: Nudix family hydrolase [Gammaproteobacteria bacterium]|nr:Nudix family hydrolase [Gammaproteobacteria bacterium]